MGSPCQIFAEIVLDDPNDGATELKRDRLPGGLWVDHSLRECHIDSLMRYPGQCNNATRNSEMNKYTAR